MPTNLFQRVGNFWEQRKEYRAAALVALRKREGLPFPVDSDGVELETRFDDSGEAHYYRPDGSEVDRVMWQGTGRNGKPGTMAIGQRQQPSATVIDEKGIRREVPTAAVSDAWNRPDTEFKILEVSEDGRRIEDELRDLARDVAGFERAHPETGPRVDLGVKGEQAPGLVLKGTSDDEIDEALQKFLRRE